MTAKYGTKVKNINELEVVHTGFLKKTLGAKPQTSTLAVYGECGRFPLELRQKELTLKYWRRLLKLPIDNPLHIVYKKLIQLHTIETGARLFLTYYDHLDLKIYLKQRLI